jgi:RND superfamily putative drug exporter
VLVAGSTVITAILGLWVSGVPFVGLAASAAAIVVAVAVVGAVTLLPALLGLIGHRVDRLRVPRVGRLTHHTHDESGRPHGFARWAERVTRRPVVYLVAGLALIVALALPALDLRLGTVDAGSFPESHTDRRAYDLLSGGFGAGSNGPLQIVADLQGGGRRDAVERVRAAIGADDGIASVGPARYNAAGDTAAFEAVPTTAPGDDRTAGTVRRLRDSTIPAALGRAPAEVAVTGPTAVNIDLAAKLSSRLPWFVLAVVLISFVLLTCLFRSIVVPLKAAVMNLLSVGAAYGVIVAVFQWGWGRSLLGVDEAIPIETGLPMIMFAVLFGLSMDYEVFLLSRIRERYLETGDNLRAVSDGLASTARIITAAALIMICVFLSFALNPLPIVKLLGVGLATAVLVDATIVRLLLVPATMALLGDRNWWMPRILERHVPRFEAA